jgi:lipoyl synthase
MSSRNFPEWIRRNWPSGQAHEEMKGLLDGLKLHTVCQSAHCPNQGECWGRRTATFMVLGNVCTRHCRFCAVNAGHPAPPDPSEPENMAEAVQRLGLRHVVITTVTRDDLPDGGADHIARVVESVKARNPETTIEVLVQDFGGDPAAIGRVLSARPEVFGHNIETVERLHPVLRDRRFSYRASLETLRIAADSTSDIYIKSALMLGCGETEAELKSALEDLLEAGCTVVSMGQYLQPTPKHYPVAEYLDPAQFKSYEAMAYDMGFEFAVAGPFVRSSYRSEELLQAGVSLRKEQTP